MNQTTRSTPPPTQVSMPAVQLPTGAWQDPDGNWFTIHSGTLGLFINKDALAGKPLDVQPDPRGHAVEAAAVI